ncbi:tumor necrosis factor receptor superfamily member 13B [Cololabis saira]|uniref:tumor necrosis factor receptor superfamily member 13B n=1 Tax=Cololabis saira TaxID=129043 RepID=UPI002AD47A35|nr:tumor necrosis factor receptor superfamily member 13B [Cololabis saira]
MGGRCKEDEYQDLLIRQCRRCRPTCGQHHIPKCASYCTSALCEAKPGHCYDRLLKACLKCEDISGRHPPECNQHCPALSRPAITKKLVVDGTTQVWTNRAPRGLEDSAILLYSLLAVCMVLLFSSLCLALIVFLRGKKAKSPAAASTGGGDHKGKSVVKPGQESGQAAKSSKDVPTSLRYPTYREPSDDSSPTENCTCVHCFPDLRAFGQDSGRPPRAQYSLYQEGVPQRPHVQDGGSICVAGSLLGSGIGALKEATMG